MAVLLHEFIAARNILPSRRFQLLLRIRLGKLFGARFSLTENGLRIEFAKSEFSAFSEWPAIKRDVGTNMELYGLLLAH